MKNTILITLVSLISFGALGQDFIKPVSWTIDKEYAGDVISFDGVPYDKLAQEDLINDQDKSIPWRFGYEFPTNIDPATHGETLVLDNGDQLWRVNINAPGAFTVNLLFDWYKLSEGATVRIYSDDRTDVSKVYTYEQNNDEQILGTWPIASDNVWVEFYEPKDVIGKSRLEIGTVVYGYRSFGDSDLAKALNDSGACNHDVNCDITPPGSDPFSLNQVKEDVKKSVAMIVLGSGLCTGSLVNNTSNNKEPYFLTANHCLSSSVGSWAFRFNWRSTVNRCASFSGSVSGAFNQTASGAQLLMNSNKSDAVLLRITDAAFFNSNPDVVWAGWNRSTTNIPNLTFGVHHPSGDVQKVCRDDNNPARVDTPFNGNNAASMWLINNNTGGWELGVTEPGSSGSPLFNQLGQVVGVLSAGSAACSGTVDNGGFDIYGRFGVAWDFGSTSSSRLRDWLDPTNTGVTSISTLSSEDLASIPVISVYPNPSTGVFTVALDQEASYEVYDLSGKLITQGALSDLNNKVDISGVSNGLYFITVSTTSGSVTEKLVKE